MNLGISGEVIVWGVAFCHFNKGSMNVAVFVCGTRAWGEKTNQVS